MLPKIVREVLDFFNAAFTRPTFERFAGFAHTIRPT